MRPGRPLRVLFLCTGNSARSILFEATLNHFGQGRFEALSAGSQPMGEVNPNALAELRRLGVGCDGLRSKSWDEYTGPTAPAIDLVITVCDNAAAESCPVFFGDFIKAHWGLPDPVAVTGDEATISNAFRRTQAVVLQRIEALVALPVEDMEVGELRRALVAINERHPAAPLLERNA